MKKINNKTKIFEYIHSEVSNSIEDHYPEHSVFLNLDGHLINIVEVCQNSYGHIIDNLIENIELENLNSSARTEFIYGEDSMNNKIIELIDSIIQNDKSFVKE